MDYHKNMNCYLNSKLYLFKNLLNKKTFCITDETNNFFKKLKKICKIKNININSVGYDCGNLKILSQKHKNHLQEIEFLYKKKPYQINLPIKMTQIFLNSYPESAQHPAAQHPATPAAGRE